MKLRYLLPFAVLALFFVACEIEDDADGDVTSTPDTQVQTCDPACAAGETCVNGTCQAGTPDNLDYRFVRIDDVSGNYDTPDGGADIDAIILFKSDGRTLTAAEVEGFEHGGGLGTEVNPEDALGNPDAFEDYMANGDASTCRVDGGFVSLGGDGGYLITSFAAGEAMEAGDELVILEVGGCDYGGGEAIVDDVDVYVSVARDINEPYWQILGSSVEGPEIAFTLTAGNLPPVAVGTVEP